MPVLYTSFNRTQLSKLMGYRPVVSFAAHAIAELAEGREAWITPRGNSMRPKVTSGARVRVTPIRDPASLRKGDIVLVKVGRSVYLHLISATDKNRVQISNNKGRVNGWVSRDSVFGIATEIINGP